MTYVAGVSTPILSKTKPYVPYVVGVSTPMPLKRKLYVMYVVGVSAPILQRGNYLPYVVGVGSPIPFLEAESFSYTTYVVGVATDTSRLAECQSADFFFPCVPRCRQSPHALRLSLLSTNH